MHPVLHAVTHLGHRIHVQEQPGDDPPVVLLHVDAVPEVGDGMEDGVHP